LEVKIGMARLYSLDKKKNEAKQIIKSLYKEYPYNTDVLLLTGNLYREELKYKQAQAFFESAIIIQPGNTAARIGLITSYIGDKKLKQADTAVEQLLAVDAEHETGNHLQAIIAYEMKDYTKALQAIKVVEKNNRNHKGILLVAGSVYYQQGKFDLAETKLKEFLEIKPDDLATKKMLSAIYLKRNQGSQVINLLRPYEDNNDTSVLSLLSSAYKTIGNQKKSSEYLEKALKISPDNTKILAQKRLNNVLTNNTEALNLVDDHFEDFKNIGLPKVLQLLKNKNTAEAIQLLKGYQLKV
ncbi:MAG: tetratricopeptide repeat protein, partial [gamma proteobacterium symbiont of Bathyaustriella thionipta]|nr:tetratricopeptide repeat protein [gamma proteobacterium symbiont of Bathyaustriella thionipta]